MLSHFHCHCQGRLRKKCVASKSAPYHRVMCPNVISSQKVVTMSVESFEWEAPGQVKANFFCQKKIFFKLQPYTSIFLLLLTSPTLKCRPHTPSYLWVKEKCCLFGVGHDGEIFLWMISLKIWIFGQKTQCLAPKRVILGNLGQKGLPRGHLRCPARNPKLPSDSLGYGDDISMLEKSVGVQKMEVYGCSVDIFQFFGPKMGLKPAQGRPVQCFQHKKSLFTSF